MNAEDGEEIAQQAHRREVFPVGPVHMHPAQAAAAHPQKGQHGAAAPQTGQQGGRNRVGDQPARHIDAAPHEKGGREKSEGLPLETIVHSLFDLAF